MGRGHGGRVVRDPLGLARWRERREAPEAEPIPTARVAAVAAGALAAAAVLGYIAWDRSAEFIGGRDVIGSGALANLFDPIPPSQALGLWLSSDYRIVEVSALGQGGAFTILLALLGLVALGLGVLRFAREREPAVISALLVAAGAWVVAAISLGPYVASKSLAIISPLVMLAAIAGIAPRDESDRAWIARAVLGAAFVAIALGPSYLALAGARLDRDDHETQLAQFRDEVDGSRVLFLGSDEYVPWYLRGADVEAAFGTVPGCSATPTAHWQLAQASASTSTLTPRRRSMRSTTRSRPTRGSRASRRPTGSSATELFRLASGERTTPRVAGPRATSLGWCSTAIPPRAGRCAG